MKTPVPNHIEIKVPDLETIIVRGFYESEESILYVTIPGNIIEVYKDTLIGIVAELDADQAKSGFLPMPLSEFYASADLETLESIMREDGQDPDADFDFSDEQPNALGRMHLAFAAIKGERRRQHAKWGKQQHPPLLWSAIINEESGELAKAALDCHLSGNASETLAAFYNEAMQCAAVGCSIMEDYEERYPEIIAGHHESLSPIKTF